MIAKTHQRGWEIIYQKAHGLLAMEFGLHWETAQRPPRFAETLAAILEHDDGLNDTEVHALTDVGAPLHFELLEYTIEQCRSVTHLTRQKSRWTALMVSLHMSFLYEEKRGQDAELAAFLEEQKAWQRRYLRELGIKREVAQRAYEFLEWCDAFSLLLCQDKIQMEQRKMEISNGPDGTVHQVWQRDDGSLCVEPWPFAVDHFEVSVESRIIEQLKFDSTDELRTALETTDPIENRWRLRK
ncbi:MAG: DUF3891 family protein [Cytophagaceae bacterium]|nr:DUF3891 family protein [Cytophagaceae bacterium]